MKNRIFANFGKPTGVIGKLILIISNEALDEQKLKEVIEATGYRVLSYKCEPYEKKHLFSFGKR